MATCSARSHQLLFQVLSIYHIAERIVDLTLTASNAQHVELGDLNQHKIFTASTRALIPLGLSHLALERRWQVLKFIDRQTTSPGVLDTPLGYMPQLRNFEVVHDLEFLPSCPTTPVYHHPTIYECLEYWNFHNINYSLRSRRLSSVAHEHRFTRADLLAYWNQPTGNRRRSNFQALFHGWISDIVEDRAGVGHRVTLCLTDCNHPHDTDDELDMRFYNSTEIAAYMMGDGLGRVFRIF